jgi:hypothetical protein
MKAKLIETSTLTAPEQRIWIVEKPNGVTKVFFKKSEAKQYKTKFDKH